MRRKAADYFGGADAVVQRIAAAVRVEQPDHPIATSDNPAAVISQFSKGELLELLGSMGLSMDEAIGVPDVTDEELPELIAEADCRVVSMPID